MEVIEIPGATGYIDTDFTGKANAAISALRNGADLAYIHVEAPDECGHRGEVTNKIKSIELIDELVLAPVLKAFENEHIKILITPDHPTPLALKTHTREAVPFMFYDSMNAVKSAQEIIFNEENAEKTGIYIEKGHELMERFING
jgi:2,3-bisphosphoglycerate-independent phosphoglycerate mutase